jgi:hypothetical protein
MSNRQKLKWTSIATKSIVECSPQVSFFEKILTIDSKIQLLLCVIQLIPTKFYSSLLLMENVLLQFMIQLIVHLVVRRYFCLKFSQLFDFKILV